MSTETLLPNPSCTVSRDAVSAATEAEEAKASLEVRIPRANERASLGHRVWTTLRGVAERYWSCYICLILSASVGFALTLTCIKVLSETASVFQVAAARAVFISSVLLMICYGSKIPLTEPRDKLHLMIGRGIAGGISYLCMSLATCLLPLSDSAFMSNNYPAVAALLSWTLGMEQLKWRSWLGVVGCLVGNAFIAHPPFLFGGHTDWDANRLLGITASMASNLLLGISVILLRLMGKSVNCVNPTAYMHVFLFLMSAPFVIGNVPEPFRMPQSSLEFACYIVMCVTGVFSQVAQSRALQIGPPTKTTTLLMTNMLLASFVGIMFLSESISLLSGIGALIVVFSIVLVTMRDADECIPGDSYHSSPRPSETV